jgi:hypothetical protein
VFKLFKGEDVESVESAVLETRDRWESEFVDADGNPINNYEYTLKMPDGTEKTEKTDEKGIVKADLLAGKYHLKLNEYEEK